MQHRSSTPYDTSPRACTPGLKDVRVSRRLDPLLAASSESFEWNPCLHLSRGPVACAGLLPGFERIVQPFTVLGP
eukprot:363607-Chlamydomonas_euryale.AAC.1